MDPEDLLGPDPGVSRLWAEILKDLAVQASRQAYVTEGEYMRQLQLRRRGPASSRGRD